MVEGPTGLVSLRRPHARAPTLHRSLESLRGLGTRQRLRVRRTCRSRSSVLNIGRINAENNPLSASSTGRKVAFVRWHFL